MFNIFGKKENKIIVKDIIWLNKQAKHYACIKQLQKNDGTVFIAWFNETADELNEFLQNTIHVSNKVLMAREASVSRLSGSTPVFIEHYPLKEKEIQLFNNLQLKEVQIHSSLDEALFIKCGGENLQQLMIKMGMSESEPIENVMITLAIKRIQEKIAKKVLIEQNTLSQEEWFRVNVNDNRK